MERFNWGKLFYVLFAMIPAATMLSKTLFCQKELARNIASKQHRDIRWPRSSHWLCVHHWLEILFWLVWAIQDPECHKMPSVCQCTGALLRDAGDWTPELGTDSDKKPHGKETDASKTRCGASKGFWGCERHVFANALPESIAKNSAYAERNAEFKPKGCVQRFPGQILDKELSRKRKAYLTWPAASKQR